MPSPPPTHGCTRYNIWGKGGRPQRELESLELGEHSTRPSDAPKKISGEDENLPVGILVDILGPSTGTPYSTLDRIAFEARPPWSVLLSPPLPHLPFISSNTNACRRLITCRKHLRQWRPLFVLISQPTLNTLSARIKLTPFLHSLSKMLTIIYVRFLQLEVGEEEGVGGEGKCHVCVFLVSLSLSVRYQPSKKKPPGGARARMRKDEGMGFKELTERLGATGNHHRSPYRNN